MIDGVAGPGLHVELTVRRGGISVVRDVQFSVTTGTATGVLGRNGAGKTTLLHGICGLLPSTGTVRLGAKDLSALPPFRRSTAGLALVPQGRRLFPELTTADNLRAATIARTGDGPDIDIHSLFPDLRSFLDRRAGVLSGGQQQQVAIARALLRRPTALLLDEPTEGLAPALIDQLTDALGELIGRGLTLIVAEQHLDVLERLCTQLVVLRAGAAVARGQSDSAAVRDEALAL